MRTSPLRIAIVTIMLIAGFAASTAQNITIDVSKLAELKDAGPLKANTSYKITTPTTLTAKTVPSSVKFYIMPGGRLNVSEGTLTCDKNTAFYLWGNLKLEEATIVLGEGSHLAFEGAKITGSGTITGNNTTLTAPIKQIFSGEVTVNGTWTIDRAYPQWFYTESNDWTPALHKAFAMKQTGEVFLPRGIYPIASTIYVPYGIDLRGETGRYENSDEQKGSVIKPQSAKAKFNGDYMMAYNIKHTDGNGREIEISQEKSTWETAYPRPGTKISGLYFYNDTKNRHKGILMAGSVSIDECLWRNCLQAIASLNGVYSDFKVITNCSFSDGYLGKVIREESPVAFDLSSLGDGLVFTGNQIERQNVKHGGLTIKQCHGATITGNIINADINFKNCKGMVFSGNHCEYNTQIVLDNSAVSFYSNFYETGARPTFIIKGKSSGGSVATMNNEQFLIFDGFRPVDKTKETVEQAKKRITELSEYDIVIDDKSSLSLNNTFRYNVPVKFGAEQQTTYGVSIGKLDKNGEAMNDASFARYSHQLSSAGQISAGNKSVKFATSSVTLGADVSLYGINGNVPWLGKSGNYSYSYEILDDNGNVTKRGELQDRNGSKRLSLTEGGDGVLFSIKGGENGGLQLYIRLHRSDGRSAKTVNVPISGAQQFYDNGISVAGYKWK